MLSPEFGAVDGEARVHRRQNKFAPCPGGNGTTIGSVQQFTVLCGTSIDGDVLDRLDAFDFTACVDLCSSFHPKCDGATFDGAKCSLRANLKPSEQRRSRRLESAVASFPGASSNCASLGGSQEALGTSFTTMCGFIIDGSDISQNFAPTFQDCLGQCATTSGCAAVSFDPSQDLGFKNCYLKTAGINASSIGADRRTDSAMVAAAAADPPPSSSPPPPPATSSTPPQSTPVAVVPTSSAAAAAPPGAGGGVIFFTPPGGSTTIVATPPASTQPAAAPAPDSSTANPAASDASTQSPSPANPLASLFPSSSLPSTTTAGGLPFVFPSPATMPPVSSSLAIPESAGGGGQDSNDGPSSMAWVAAPVVGGVAAIALIGVSFVMLKRRRRGSGGSGGSSMRKETISRPSPLSGLFTAFLPASWSGSSSASGAGGPEMGMRSSDTGMTRGGSARSTNSGRRMGNFSEVESGRRSAGSESRMSMNLGVGVRGSVVGFMTGRPMGMERLEDIEEGESAGVRTGSGSRAGSRGGTPVMGERERDGRAELRKSFNGLGQNKWGQ